MEGVAATASIIAVVQITAEVAKLFGGYIDDVQHARQDVERLKTKVVALHDVLERLQNSSQLDTSRATIQQCFYDLKELKDSLEPKKSQAAMKRFGLRALKWPFSSKDIDQKIKALESYLLIFNTALQLNMGDKVSNAEQNRMLDKLAHVSDAPFDSYENQRHRSCLEDTRVAVLQRIMLWARITSPQCILWLKGMAGTGKSTIAITVASRLSKESKNVATYFFRRGAGDLAHAKKLVSTLAYQLANTSTEFRHELLKILQEEPSLGSSASLRVQFDKLFLGPISRIQSQMSAKDLFVIIIDALDECEEQQDIRILLKLLAQIDSQVAERLRIFVTSRPEIPVRLGFQDMPRILYQDIVLHDEPRSVVDKDIELFLRDELKQIASEHGIPCGWPEDSQIQNLVEKAAGLFVFASTACRYINDSPQALPEHRINQICSYITATVEMTRDLDQMYTLILQNAIKGSFGEEEQARFRRVVGTISVLLKPLAATELQKLVYGSRPDGHRLVEHSLRALHAVIDVPISSRRPILLLHLSFRDFLLDSNRCPDKRFWIEETRMHHELASDCVRLMSSTLHRDMCRLPTHSFPSSDINEKELNDALSPAVQYSCRYWIDHAQKGHVDLYDHGDVHKFLLQFFLYWLEAMSLMGRVSEAVIAFRSLEAMVDSQISPIMSDLIREFQRFLLTFRYVISHFPRQIYTSALMFSPTKSAVRKLSEYSVPKGIKLNLALRETWSANLLNFERHMAPVVTISFSPKGETLASGSHGAELRIWDIKTGDCQFILDGHSEYITEIKFSPDGQSFASASTDGRIRLWHSQDGEALHVLDRHKGRVNSMTFSPNGHFLASGSDDWTVQLWDTLTGQPVFKLEGHTGEVVAVAISPDGHLITIGSSDCNVRLWDALTGQCRAVLEGHMGPITGLAFALNGEILVSGSRDHTIRLWHTLTRDCLHILIGHTQVISTIAISPDGQSLASGSRDTTVRLWDLRTGLQQSIIRDHDRIINSIAFSHNGHSMASGSAFMVVIWDMKKDECRSKLIGNFPSIHCLQYSPDDRYLATGCQDGLVRLWDAHFSIPGPAHTDDRSPEITEVTFSHNGQLIAVGSSDGTLQLWNTRLNKSQARNLKGHFDRVTSISFTTDDLLLVSGSWDRKVLLWDAIRGTRKSCFEIDDMVRIVQISPDGQLFIVVTGRRKIQIWDLNTAKIKHCIELVRMTVLEIRISPDSQLLFIMTKFANAQLWNLMTGEQIFSIDCSSPLSMSWFYPEHEVIFVDDRAFDTTSGREKSVAIDTQLHDLSDRSLKATDDWVCRGSEPLIWMPADYRGIASASFEDTVVIGTAQGQLYSMSIDQDFGR